MNDLMSYREFIGDYNTIPILDQSYINRDLFLIIEKSV